MRLVLVETGMIYSLIYQCHDNYDLDPCELAYYAIAMISLVFRNYE